jgi:hypothetical protein
MAHRTFLAACLVAAAGVARAQMPPAAPVVASPKTWGSRGGSTTMMAHDFAEKLTGYFVSRYLGAMYCYVTPATDPTVEAFAQVDAPDGATLSQLQFWAYDVDPADGLNVSLWEACQAPGGNPVSIQLASVDTFGAIGTYFGFTPLNNHRVNNRECTYTVRVQFNPGPVDCTGAALQLQKVEVDWVRDVAPPVGQPSFSDVPADHPFYRYIEALYSSAVTGGCGDLNFCPDAPLTRGQMATFLAKALGLQWP